MNHATRLSSAALADLPADWARPAYDRDQPCGVVHLGIGAFHRAHQAVFFDALLAAGHCGWMIRGASLRSPAVAQAMNPQDGLFTVLVRDGAEERPQVAGSVRDVLVAPDDPQALVRALADPAVALVTLTVTEKGYCLDPATGALRADDPAVAADIANLASPQTAPGFLVAGLAARRMAGVAPFTVLSCDNLPENGQRTRAAVLALAEAVDPALAAWIAREVAFPSSMVDRIVPATTPDDLDNFESATGWRDEALVKTEPFSQWVVEDWFCNRRPPLDEVGAQFTRDVAGWEKAKLRLLNGAHSAIAYLGGLAGYAHVHQAMAAPGFAALIEALWDEAGATLAPVDGFDPAAYRAQLRTRFANGALMHRTNQIAMDGSQKLPQRWLQTILEIRRAGRAVPPALTLALAGWMRWQAGVNDAGARHSVDDPLAAETACALANAAGDPAAEVRALLANNAIFGSAFPADADFVAQLTRSYVFIRQEGAAAAVQAFVDARD
ncbi:mannitol dehydrogenase family protein [Porphyrobacter sp. AAP60]|uniref:mannitol dehydrogenase family protein n=1 Tax=Porphyrobacter sp. AAP60 TaxID=1523423 RepID=UPI0006B8EBAA|nr:mannitol dehydrogenase family protein [Porphyrobacter sp. AAP60]KPF65588.1 dioxygenase [Porphyrobacter sp. AAP60]